MRYIKEQLVFFPNSTRVTDSWIVSAKVLFDTVIFTDDIPISDMPPIIQADLDEEKNEKIHSILFSFEKNILDSAFEEMQHISDLHQIPSKDSLLSLESKDEALNWNAL